MRPIERVVFKASLPQQVTRRDAGVVGPTGRLAPPVELTVTVAAAVQPASATSLVRALPGDVTAGQVNVWTSATKIADAFATGDQDETPLGWTGLRVAPPRGTAGPPGDLLTWQGRKYEITGEELFDFDGLIHDAGLRRYRATERGVG